MYSPASSRWDRSSDVAARILHSSLRRRAACYRFDQESNSWKERGRGDVKLLQNKNTKSIRILLRQEKTLKLCMNHKGQTTRCQHADHAGISVVLTFSVLSFVCSPP
jgi:hypothetical protein